MERTLFFGILLFWLRSESHAQTTQPFVAFVSFAVRHGIRTPAEGLSELTVTTASLSHPASAAIEGTDLWRLGFFASANDQGTGPRVNEIHQLLTEEQASQPATPGQNVTFVASFKIDPAGQEFPYHCTEFAKDPAANPDFTFRIGNDVKPIVLCQRRTDQPDPSASLQKNALFTSMAAWFEISRNPDDTIPSRTSIRVTLSPHPSSDMITGTDLWRLGFFGSRNPDGSGERKNEAPQLLLPSEARTPLNPEINFSLSVSRLLSMSGIGLDQEFPHFCVEFGKSAGATPDFLFLGKEDDDTIVLCKNSGEAGGETVDRTQGRVVQVLTSNVVTAESSRGPDLTVGVNIPTSEDITVVLSVSDGSLVTVSDIVIPAGQLTGSTQVISPDNEDIPAGGTSNLTVSINPSVFYETGARDSAPVTVLDDDTEQLMISFASTERNVHEDDGNITVMLPLNKADRTRNLTFNFRVREGDPPSAIAGRDFKAETITAVLPAGLRLLRVTFAVIDDEIRERNESFAVEIDETTLPSGIKLIGQNHVKINVADDDGCPPEYFELSKVCYRKVDTPMAFEEARAECHKHGAEVASASTPLKNVMISSLAYGERCWLGATAVSDVYTWLNGDNWWYANWRKQEPNWHLGAMPACIETNFVGAMLWNDHFCKAERVFVCEKPIITEN